MGMLSVCAQEHFRDDVVVGWAIRLRVNVYPSHTHVLLEKKVIVFEQKKTEYIFGILVLKNLSKYTWIEKIWKF